MVDDARKYDFLEGGGTLEYAPRAPAVDAVAMEKARLLRASQTIRDTAAKTSARNTTYREERRLADQQAVITSNISASSPEMLKGTGAWNFAGQDWGLLPAAARVTTELVAIAATGGLAAPVVAAEWNKVKTVIEGTAKIDSVSDAVATGRAILKVPDVIGDQMMAAQAAADQILKADARDVVAATQAAALAGDIEAQRGAVILAKVAGARRAAGVGAGQALIPLNAEQSAQVAVALGGALTPNRPSDVRHWWQKIIDWVKEKL